MLLDRTSAPHLAGTLGASVAALAVGGFWGVGPRVDSARAGEITASSLVVPGTSDPYLAGMPDGSTASFGDVAPAQSPPQVTGVAVAPGMAFTFSVAGSVSYYGATPTDPPDGNSGYIETRGAENGLSGYRMPIDSLVGVFLGPDRPDLSSPPPDLDFSMPASREFLTLLPLLQQVFFIGDGLTGGGLVQEIVAPAAATRLFLGTADGIQWFNNSGSFTVSVTAVPEPSTACMALAGLAWAAALMRPRTGGPTSSRRPWPAACDTLTPSHRGGRRVLHPSREHQRHTP